MPQTSMGSRHRSGRIGSRPVSPTAWAELNISNDDFIRTTEPRHHRTVQQFLQKIYDNGWIVKDTYSGLYCVPCEQYYNETELLDGNLCPIHRDRWRCWRRRTTSSGSAPSRTG